MVWQEAALMEKLRRRHGWIFSLAIKQAQAIEQGFVKFMPKYSQQFSQNFANLKKRLIKIDRDIQKITSKKPHIQFIASHPVYQYFARRYHVPMWSLHWEPDQFPTVTQWQHFKALLQQHPVRWMIWEKQPLLKTVVRLKSMHIGIIVFDSCGNKPARGGFF